jgi:hypothetical protein
MKRRITLLLLGLILGVVAGFVARRHLGTAAPSSPADPLPEVAIQDGKTIDFSGGKAVVRDNPEERAAMERALKEMEEAAKDVTFGPTKPPPPAPAP